MDVVEALPVETVVLETRAECSDGERSRAALDEALTAARAPARGGPALRGARATREPRATTGHWTVTMSVVGPRTVAATIVDDTGTLVAQRTLTDRGAKVCLPLARAVGAWASLVLDAEVARTKDDDGSEPTPPSSTLATTAAAGGETASSGDAAGHPARAARDRASSADGSDAAAASHRVIELGMMGGIENGLTSTGGFGGVSPFATIEVAPSWVLRPSLSFGRSTGPISVTATESSMMSHVAGRADFCRRVPGNYVERRGIEADMCLGLESGAVTSDHGGDGRSGSTALRLGGGPSIILRGELGAGLALEVRGLFGANFLNKPVGEEQSAPLVFAAAELGVSVRLP